MVFSPRTCLLPHLRGRNVCHSSRKGTAVVETALCIPVIIILMLGTVEVSSRFYLKESLTIAAYEGARTGAKRRATKDDVINRVEDILAARNVSLGASGSITVTPNDLSSLRTLDPFTVTVTAPSSGNCTMVFNGIADQDITGIVKMAREFDH